jgi:hypothetical protein
VLEWPPDLFALIDVVLHRSEAYRLRSHARHFARFAPRIGPPRSSAPEWNGARSSAATTASLNLSPPSGASSVNGLRRPSRISRTGVTSDCSTR